MAAKYENSTQQLIKGKTKSLQELMAEDMEAFENFMYMIIISLPHVDRVRVILDDGQTRLTMRRDNFLERMEKIVPPENQRNRYILFRFKEAVASFGKLYYYDRLKNEFKELMESIDLEHLRPSEVFQESRKSLVKQELNSQFGQLTKQYNSLQELKVPDGEVSNRLNRFGSFIRELPKKVKRLW
jgi:hypothetical protein